MFQPGDRVRWSTDSDDGLPWTRYGFVGAIVPTGYACVMFDGELKSSTMVPVSELVAVSVTAVELRLDGADLIEDSTLRRGLVSLWFAEADEAGLEIDTMTSATTPPCADGKVALAELRSGGTTYLLTATPSSVLDEVWVRAESISPTANREADHRRSGGVGGS